MLWYPNAIRRAGAATVMCVAVAISASPSACPAEPELTPTTAAPTAVDTSRCPFRQVPIAPVDDSETVAPGFTTPSALPVPTPPIGGGRLGECDGITSGPPPPSGLTSAGWLVADLDTGKVLAAKDPHGRYRPASTIKVLLALIVLDQLDLDQVVTGTDQDAAMEGDSAGIGPGGRYTVRQLLSGLLMVSGNDCAHALATLLGGNDVAVSKMNARAQALGAKDTRVASPSGLDAPGMSSSPYDLALIFRAALSNPVFASIVRTSSMDFPGYPPRPGIESDPPHPGYQMWTQDRLILDDYPGALGGKTGYTDDAHKTFVGAAARDGHRVVVTQMYGLNLPGDDYWDHTKALLDYGFSLDGHGSVGDLIALPPGVTSSPTLTASGAHAASGKPSSQGSSSNSRLLIAGIGVAAAIACTAIGLRLLRRRRG